MYATDDTRQDASKDDARVNNEDQPTAALLALRDFGWLEAGGGRVFLCDAGGFFALREQLAREVGAESQADIFYRAGFAATEKLMRHCLTHGVFVPGEDGLRRSLGLLTAAGYGAFTLAESRFDDGWAVVDARSTMESGTVIANDGTPGFVCDFTRGLLRGVMHHLQQQGERGVAVECAEIACAANDDLECRYAIGTEAELSARGHRSTSAEFVSVRETLSRLNRQMEDVLEAAQRDSLTGLYNRAYFESALRRRIEFANRRTDTLAVAMIDVDRFKEVNDTLGHGTGDLVLQQIARLIGSQGRETDVIARYGGDEFAWLMPSTPVAAALQVADRIRHLVETERITDIPLTLSIGVAACPADATTPAALIDLADEAMYQIKQGGGNGVRHYTPPGGGDTEDDAPGPAGPRRPRPAPAPRGALRQRPPNVPGKRRRRTDLQTDAQGDT